MAKYVSPRFTTLNWGRGGDEVCSVNVHELSNLGWIDLKGYVQDCNIKSGLCFVKGYRIVNLLDTNYDTKCFWFNYFVHGAYIGCLKKCNY